jgi:hypothetical protein
MGLPIMVATPTLPFQFTVMAGGVIPCPGIIVTPITPPSFRIFVRVLGVPLPIFRGPLVFTIAGVDTVGNVMAPFPGVIIPSSIRVFAEVLPVIRLTDFVLLPVVPVVNGSGVPLVLPYTVVITNAGQINVLSE